MTGIVRLYFTRSDYRVPAFLPVAGFFTTGTSAVIPMGAPVKAFIDEDVPIAFAPGAAPAPMVVPAGPQR